VRFELVEFHAVRQHGASIARRSGRRIRQRDEMVENIAAVEITLEPAEVAAIDEAG